MKILSDIQAQIDWAQKMADFAGWMATIQPASAEHLLQKIRFEKQHEDISRFLAVAEHAVKLPNYNQKVESTLYRTLNEFTQPPTYVKSN